MNRIAGSWIFLALCLTYFNRPALAEEPPSLRYDQTFIEAALALEHEDLVPTFHGINIVRISFQSEWTTDFALDRVQAERSMSATAKGRLISRLNELGLGSIKVIASEERGITLAERCTTLDILFRVHLEKVKRRDAETALPLGVVYMETLRQVQAVQAAGSSCDAAQLRPERGVSTLRLFAPEDDSPQAVTTAIQSAIAEATDKILLHVALANDGAMRTIHHWAEGETKNGGAEDRSTE